MRHHPGRGFVVAEQRIPADRDPRRHDQPVVVERRAAAQAHPPRLCIDCHRLLRRDRDAFVADRLITEALRRDVAQTADHGVAERAGGKNRVGLDEGDIEPRIGAAQRPRAGRPGEPAAEHDNARLRLSRGGREK